MSFNFKKIVEKHFQDVREFYWNQILLKLLHFVVINCFFSNNRVRNLFEQAPKDFARGTCHDSQTS